MKTIQEYLKNAQIDRLIRKYFQVHPIIYERDADRETLTVGQIRALREKRLTEYIHYLQSLAIEPCEDGREYILFAYKYVYEGNEEKKYALVCKQEVLEQGVEAETYFYLYSRHSEVMGYLVSEAEFTQRNLYGLMADVLFLSSPFGYEEELKETVKASMYELVEDEREEADELETELYYKLADARTNYNNYCFRKEKAILKRLLTGATREELDGFEFYDDVRFTRLEKKYRGSYLPEFDHEMKLWVVATEHGVEYGDVEYVAGEFCGNNLLYLFNDTDMPDPKKPNHGHEFGDIIKSLLRDPDGFSVEDFKECYAEQQLRILRHLQDALLTVRERNYPLSWEEKKRNREC